MESEETGLISDTGSADLYIQYGDIVSLHAPSNTELHQHTFFVDYVSEAKIRLLGVASLELTTLYLTDTGHFRDESIELVELLSRADERGYARQAGLVPKTWIKVEFGGEFPMLVVGEITALDEDQIEVTTYPTREVLYIDFAYQGLPEELHIEGLEVVDAPKQVASETDVGSAGEPLDIDDVGAKEGVELGEEHTPELAELVADSTVMDTLHQMYLDANDIVFSLDEDDVVVGQVVEISEHEKIYSVDTQLNDMLDELLSTIPDVQRSPVVMDRVHRLLARFRELRSRYSRTDGDTGRVLGPRLRTALASDKPLVPYLQSMDPRISTLAWLVPVVSCRRKLYDVNESSIEDVTDAELLTLREDATEMMNLQKNYATDRNLGNTNHDRYMHLQSRMSESLCPFVQSSTNAVSSSSNVSSLSSNVSSSVSSVSSNPIDTVIDNNVWDDSGKVISTALYGSEGYVQTSRFVAQRFQPGETMLRPVYVRGKQVFERTLTSPNENMQIRAWIALYPSWMEFTRVRLPNTNIMGRAGHMWPMRFRRLPPGSIRQPTKRSPDVLLIESGTGAVAAGVAEETFTSGRNDKLFVLEHDTTEYERETGPRGRGETGPRGRGRGESDDVGAMIPDTIHLMDSLQTPTSTSLSALMTRLEPFLVYTDDLTYTQYKQAKHFIHVHIRNLKQRVQDGKHQCDLWRNHRFTHTFDSASVSIDTWLRDHPEFVDHAKQVYASAASTKVQASAKVQTSSELWSSILHTDGGIFMTMLIRALFVKLHVPVSFLEGVSGVSGSKGVDDMDALEKIKPTDCARRFLAKKYTSLGELQQDNHEGIFYDKEMDDTPYGLLKAYASEKKSMTRDAFEAYLAENLVQKHGCPRNQSLELAHTLIEGKKPVRDGEYAVLSVSPTMTKSGAKSGDNSTKSDSGSEPEIVSSTYTTKHTYYKRTRGVWIKDDTTSGLNENSFVDSNTLFCNIQSSCTKLSAAQGAVCAPISGVNPRIPTSSGSESARKELAERWARTAEDVEKTLENDINLHLQRMSYLERLRSIQHTRYNLYGWSLGKHVKEVVGVVSPAAAIRDQMLAETDFVLRQHHIVAFVDNYARTPMVETLREDAHWMYCIDTNTRLLPAFLYELARAFTTGGSAGLNSVMDRVIQRQGVVSDDGDTIVDKYSGYTIRKMDTVAEDEFDDVTGARIVTHGMLTEQKDAQEHLAASVAAAIAGKGNAGAGKRSVRTARVFENVVSEDIYRMWVTMGYQNMGLEPSEALEDFVIRIASELATNQIRSEASYEAASRKMEKEKGKKLMPYATYRRQTLTFIVGAVALVGIQTTVPPFRVHKTFPGCVQSFHGFPLAGIEDLSSVTYVSCVLSSQDPSLKRKLLEEKIRGVLIDTVLPMSEVQERYQTRHEYDQKYGIQRILPELHSLARWRTFLPPLVAIDADALGKTLHAVSKAQVDHLLDLMKSGHHDQHAVWAGIAGKMLRYGYGIAAGIHAVVAEQSDINGAMLQTESHVPFLQNACCAQDRSVASSLTYFETANADVRLYRQVVERLGTILNNVREASTPPLLFDIRDTRMYRSTQMSMDHTYSVALIYAAFIHYGHFDHSEWPIPDDLAGVIPDKPGVGYPASGTLDEKIEALKKMGKRYHIEQLEQLLQIVFRRKSTSHILALSGTTTGASTGTSGTTAGTTTGTNVAISNMVDFLDHLDTSSSAAVDAALRDRLLPVLAQYRVGTMVHEDSDATRALKNYLQLSNTRMRTEIVDFMRRSYGDAGSREFEQWTARTLGSTDMMHTTQFVRNSVHQMCRVFSNRIVHGNFSTYTVPVHWGVSDTHERDIIAFVEKYTHQLKPFVGDTTLNHVFEFLDTPLRDLVQLLQYIPIQSPLERDQVSYYGLFDVKTTLLLHWHVWYSVYYLYIRAANDPELVRIDVTARRNRTRQSMREEREPMQLQATSVDVGEDTDLPMTMRETMWEADDSRQEVEIRMSTQDELRRRVAELMWTYFTLDRDVQSVTDRSYDDIMTTIQAFSKAEKKTKTDYLKNMSVEERRVEFQLKTHRLGVWSVGTQKNIVGYNEETYDREMRELREQLQLVQLSSGRTESTSSTDVGELERYDRTQVNREYQQEEHGIAQYGEDYTDGDYYGEDDNEV